MASKYLHSTKDEEQTISSSLSLPNISPARESRDSISVQQRNAASDVEFIEVNRFLFFKPRADAFIENKQQTELYEINLQKSITAAQRMSIDFNLSARLRARPSVIVSHLLLTFLYVVFLITELLSSTYSAEYTVISLIIRIIVILLNLSISGIATREVWLQSHQCTNTVFILIILGKQLCIVVLHLLEDVPDYGHIMFDQAILWTFLPVHPIQAGAISIIVWLFYGVIPKTIGLGSNMPAIYPFILIGVGLIQSYGHMRRYHSMMNGFLEAKRVDIQRLVMSEESSKCDGLLRSMLPPSIIVKLELGENITPERFDSVTVLFAEICHFSGISRRATAHELVNLLNDVFTTFDNLIDKWSVYKVETVCQVYMAVSGCPTRKKDHASEAANLALDMIHAIQYLTSMNDNAINDNPSTSMLARRQRVLEFMKNEKLQIHVGLNSGPVRAGVVGINNPRFKLFGDTVNTSSRMESTCEPGRIQVSPSTCDLLQQSVNYAFELEKRGEIKVKGKGTMITHYVCSVTQVKTTTIVIPSSAKAIDRDSSKTSFSSAVHRKKSASDLNISQAKQMRIFQNMTSERDSDKLSLPSLQNIDDLEKQNQNPANNPANNAGTSSKCALFYLRLRRVALLIIESDISLETLKALEVDAPIYRSLKFTSRVNWLQLKILILLIGLSLFLSLTDYSVFLAGNLSKERQLMTLLRNAVAIPIFIVLLISCRSEVWFIQHGEQFAAFTGVVAASIMMVTIFTVYNGDPGIAAGMCILTLDIELLRLSWRVTLVIVLLLIYVVLIFISRSTIPLDTISIIVSVCVLFVLAIHGQEHFTHVADRERRDLEEQTKQLEKVRSLKWELLTDLLPRPIANQLLAPTTFGGTTQLVADVYEDVTVLFTDMKGFTAYSSKLDPGALQHFLNAMFSAFDEILEEFSLTKIEVIGDAYFVVSGAPSMKSNQGRSSDEHAGFAAQAALDMVKAVEEVCGDECKIRVGLHSGTVIGGVVGQKDPRFHLFGHTVDLANKMEEYGVPDKVHMSDVTCVRLENLIKKHELDYPNARPLFEIEDRGMIDISSEPKPIHTYFVLKSSFGQVSRSKNRRRMKENRGAFLHAGSSMERRMARGSSVVSMVTASTIKKQQNEQQKKSSVASIIE